NGIAFWFIVINIIGFFIFKRWIKKTAPNRADLTYKELGIGFDNKSEAINYILKTFMLSIITFAYIYFLESIFEHFLLIDFRYKFPYASDFTPFRFIMFLEYFILFLIGYLYFNIFLQVQLCGMPKNNIIKSSIIFSIRNIVIVIAPLLIIVAIQYIPLFLGGNVPFSGPGGALIGFIMNIEHMCVLLIMMIFISTFAYNLTGKIYLGSFLNALIVSWMFTSSSVIAPIPI
ncbi:MAG: hypothetical protein PQJ46_01635, partial [Spirochaetales bacterium]|nr:hypothetical protein [Spirochaetales bacterium]